LIDPPDSRPSQPPPPAGETATPSAYRSDAVSQPPPPTTPPLGSTAQPAPDAPRDGPALADATWGAGRAFGGLAFLVVAVILLGVIVVAFDPEVESLAAQVSLQALLAGALVLTAFLFASPGLRSLAHRETLGLRRPLRKAIWLSVIAYFGYVACAIVISLVLSPEQEDITRELGGDEGALGTIIAGILIVGIAPLSEEIFFRGFLFAGLRRAMPVAIGALIASAIWGLFHYTGAGSWGVVAQITVFGVWLSWLYERTGSIYPTIAVHAVNNAIAFTILISS
jgi:uncharacterized protein